MHWKTKTFALILTIAFSGVLHVVHAKNAPWDPSRVRGPVRTAVANPQIENRVHNAGRMWMNITNYGYFGNDGPSQSTALEDPCPPGGWAPQCEFPGGSDQQYLFQGALWIGALIEEEGFQTTRVSVGTDGWFTPSINEFYPGEGLEYGIQERSNRPGFTNCLGMPVYDSLAISDQDFVCLMADTLQDDFWLEEDPTDGPHRPLGIEIKQTSYSFSQAFAEDFILIDYEISNIASNFLKNVYVGLYVDSDCGPSGLFEGHTDDVCGFVREVDEVNSQGETNQVRIDVAWIADGDGHGPGGINDAFNIPHVTGTRVIRAPNPRLFTSFNYWISNGDPNLDWGPSWEAYSARDSLGMNWTQTYGTPVGDEHKYQVMRNCEFDFWQTSADELLAGTVAADTNCYGGDRPQAWYVDNALPASDYADLADGYDTRYLLSWGPLGIYDFTDGQGNDIYRLNPGERFRMTIAYVAGEYFHNPNNQQVSNTNLDTSKYNFEDLKNNARWAKDVYDNRMFDTPIFDWGYDGLPNTDDPDGSEGDGLLDTGDGWYGEDVGRDGLYGVIPIGVDSIDIIYFRGASEFNASDAEIFAGRYGGPDEGERNGGRPDTVVNALLNGRNPFPVHTEDDIVPADLVYAFNVFHPLQLGAWDMGWMSSNGQLDFGDGIPDFTGPPPPPIPALLDVLPNTYNAAQTFGGRVRTEKGYIGGLGYELGQNEVILRWSKKSSELSTYRDPFSRVQDFEGYRIHAAGVNLENSFELLAQFDRIDFAYFSDESDSMMTIPVEDTTGLQQRDTFNLVPAHLDKVGNNTGFAEIFVPSNSSEYDDYYEFYIPAAKLSPKYYSVTAFDFGDPKSGLGSLTTRATANAVLLAPAGQPKKPVTVVPNPYRAYQDYTASYLGQSWENQNDGTADFFPQVDRRIEFMNLPERCLIRIFTTAGDLVQMIPHNEDGDISSWASLYSEKWDLNSRNNQQVVAGIYMFSVEDLSNHQIEMGKFVIIR
jgi:hypothetical protein